MLLGLIQTLIGPTYIIFMCILCLVMGYLFISRFARYLLESVATVKGCVKWVVAGLAVVFFLIVSGVGLWTVKQNILNSLNNYDNASIQKNVKDAKIKITTVEELNKKKKELEQPLKEKHENVLSDYDKKMKEEADKIKNRNKKGDSK